MVTYELCWIVFIFTLFLMQREIVFLALKEKKIIIISIGNKVYPTDD